MAEREKILLHACCAPCAAPCVERLQGHGREVELFFANSNIDTDTEFAKRLENVVRVAEHFGVRLHVDEYRHYDWLECVRGLEDAPEKGPRCGRCFAFNLRRTERQAAELGIGKFTTSLSVSPHKASEAIFSAGHELPGFESWDFKKHDGFKRGLELSEELRLYRQNYCGCEFSKCHST